MVTFAGGWLFDRAIAGWDVTVLVASDADARPLQILGVDTIDLEPVLSTDSLRPKPHALAVAGDLYSSDKRVRRGVRIALDHSKTAVTLWGDACPAELDRSVEPVKHRLSLAARAPQMSPSGRPRRSEAA